MGPDRDYLNKLSNRDDLVGYKLTISRNPDDTRTYVLKKCVGRGATGVTWLAMDWQNTPWAIKFCVQSDYANHSLEQEIITVRKLETDRIAKIATYGVPTTDIAGVPKEKLYAIVVEWVPGDSLGSFLSDHQAFLSVPMFLKVCEAMCQALMELDKYGLCHNDLHDGNILVQPRRDPLNGHDYLDIHIIDTGSLKTKDRLNSLVKTWQDAAETLRPLLSTGNLQTQSEYDKYCKWQAWFSRSDHEWLVYHLVQLFNAMHRNLGDADLSSRRFLRILPGIIERMDDPDAARRLQDPVAIYRQLRAAWAEASQPAAPALQSPFDALSAELIRSDKQLMGLFSEEFPRLDACRGIEPIYMYGPRGSGKSTVFRALSLRAILSSPNPMDELKKTPFIGIYISCSAELRSRFWLIDQNDYDVLEPYIVRFFSLILLDGLVDTLEIMYEWDSDPKHQTRFGVDLHAVAEACDCIRRHAGIAPAGASFAGLSPSQMLSSQLRRERDVVWKHILDREHSPTRTNAPLIFDIAAEIANICPVFKQRPLTFLLDDYSSQRIPEELQRRLNHSISFTRQSNPIFKVTSEYGGVDLHGIQEGREVTHLNVGREYVDLTGRSGVRYRFLQNVVEKRLQYVGHPINLLDVIPPSGVPPATGMARKIKDEHEGGKPFHYHGIDTISDLCSGDFAMGLYLISRIFEEDNVSLAHPHKVPSQVQHKVISEVSTRNHDYIIHYAPYGNEKSLIMDQLCWLGHETVIRRVTTKDQESVPVIKIHLDIAEKVYLEAIEKKDKPGLILQDLIRKGLLFPLGRSRSREGNQITRRFQVRRILLAKHVAPLGRQTPIRIDTLQKLIWMLTSPDAFVRNEAQTDYSPGLFAEADEVEMKEDRL